MTQILLSFRRNYVDVDAYKKLIALPEFRMEIRAPHAKEADSVSSAHIIFFSSLAQCRAVKVQ